MILLKKPHMEQEVYEYTPTSTGMTRKMRGREMVAPVRILVPDEDTSKDAMWNRLKYPNWVDLQVGMKVEVIDFPEDGITLYGVLPREMERSAIWDGRLFHCSVERYEVY